MKPASTAVLYRLKEGDCEVDGNEWILLSKEDRYLPLLMHKPTGLVFGLSQDNDHPPDVLAVFAIWHGQYQDEHGNMRKIGKIAMERQGRSAIKAFLLWGGTWQDYWRSPENHHEV